MSVGNGAENGRARRNSISALFRPSLDPKYECLPRRSRMSSKSQRAEHSRLIKTIEFQQRGHSFGDQNVRRFAELSKVRNALWPNTRGL